MTAFDLSLIYFDKRSVTAGEMDMKLMALRHLPKACERDPVKFGDGMNEGAGDARVRFIQSALHELHYGDPEQNGVVARDGKFGRETQEAIKRYQREHGIKPTGTVGPVTMKMISEDIITRNRQSLNMMIDFDRLDQEGLAKAKELGHGIKPQMAVSETVSPDVTPNPKAAAGAGQKGGHGPE